MARVADLLMDLRPEIGWAESGRDRYLTVAALLLACPQMWSCDELDRRLAALRYYRTTKRRFVNPYYARRHQSIGLALRNCSLVTLTVFW